MKKYSEKFLQEYSKLKDAVIGIEFEFYLKDLSFYKTLEILNKELSPVQVHGFRQYHSNFKPDEKNFKIEPDLSGGANLVELVTGPLSYSDAKFYLMKILHFIQKYGYTNDRCSIHFNISFRNQTKDLNDLNILKLILNTNEDEIYKFYPSRKGNIYAKSIKTIIPFKEYDFFNVPIELIKNNLRLPGDKYFGINFLHILKDKKSQRLEYRYIGGKDYEKSPGTIVYFMDKFIMDVWNCTDASFTTTDEKRLENYLELNINKYKNFSKYDSFITQYPKIQLQINQNYGYDLVSSYYISLYPKLYNLMQSFDTLTECIINYVTSTQKIEIIDATVKTILTVKEIEFINCNIIEGIFEDCLFHSCQVNKSQVSKSKIHNSDIDDCKVLSCRVEDSNLKNCYFMNGYLNSNMEGGVFRSGELGPFASISSETKIVTDSDNFFDTSFETERDVDKKGIMNIKSFKK